MTHRTVAPLLAAFLLAPLLEAGSPPPLHRLGADERRERLRGDLAAVVLYRDGLARVVSFVDSRPDLFPKEERREPRVVPREEKDVIWESWKSFLDYLLALDSIRQLHGDFWRLKGEARDASFLAGRGAFLAEYRFSLELLDRLDRCAAFRPILDDAVPEMGLPAGTYSALRLRFLNVARATELATFELAARSLGGGTRGADTLLRASAEDAQAIWRMGRGRGEALTAKNGLLVAQGAGFAAWFPVQSGVAEWMGDTKVARKDRSLVSPRQIESLRPELEPGDILLERREWYLSNVGLPGYWPHAALYIGTEAERRAAFDDPEVRRWVTAQGVPDGSLESLLARRAPAALRSSRGTEHGHPFRVIEAMSEGVVFTTLEHSASCDSLAVLRPRLPRSARARAIARALAYAGRPYDFSFDFQTDSALVCTELVAKAYEPAEGAPGLRFPVADVLGRPATPANLIARQFDEQHGSAEQQSDLVAFLDGDEKGGRAVASGLAEFRRSWRRPKWHLLVAAGPPRADGSAR